VRILTALTYYRPHTSGLTIYAERIARALAGRGHQVTVLTSRYDPRLPTREERDGVRVVRAPVLGRVGKGVLMPTIGLLATREVLRHDAVLLHLPQLDAAGISLRGRLFHRPTLLTYHCDLQLPPGAVNRLANRVVDVANLLAGWLSHRVVAYTEDYAEHSPFLRRWAGKLRVVAPPVDLPVPAPEEVAAFAREHNPEGWRTIGIAARLASEKGVEVLLDALPAVFARYPRSQVLFAGQHQGVWGESAYAERLAPRLESLQEAGRWRFLGVLSIRQMAAFFSNLDLLVVPSLNSTESFGLVQVEAMTRGCPVVASDLPGVRQPVLTTGMGRVVPVGDATALGSAILGVLEAPDRFAGDSDAVRVRFSAERAAVHYEELFEEVAKELRDPVLG
jgi:glycosyltransferase involved in cell wall biosynthesis